MDSRVTRIVFFVFCSILVVSCGGGDGSVSPDRRPTIDSVDLVVEPSPVKSIKLSWQDEDAATHYN